MVKNLSVAVALAILALAVARPDDPYKHKQTYKAPAKPYRYQYAVDDKYQSLNFGHQEESDGNQVQGSWSVDLPDGRRQTTKYRADHKTGYHAEVTYEGKAQYPPKSEYPPFVVPPHKGGGGGYPEHPPPSYH